VPGIGHAALPVGVALVALLSAVAIVVGAPAGPDTGPGEAIGPKPDRFTTGRDATAAVAERPRGTEPPSRRPERTAPTVRSSLAPNV
jgi:hypothetical protein